MARTSIAAAKAELFAQIDGVTGATAVYSFEPGAGQMLRPLPVAISTAGVDPDFWTFAVRIYADTSTDAKGAQDALDALMTAVEAEVDDHWGPVNWVVVSHPEIQDVLVAEWLVSCGRED